MGNLEPDSTEELPMNQYEIDLVENFGMKVARDAARKILRTAPHALDYDELLSCSYMGLVQATKRWKPFCERRTQENIEKAARLTQESIDRCKETGEEPTYFEPEIYDPARTDFYKVYAYKRCWGAAYDHLRQIDHASRALRGKSKRLREAGQDEGATMIEMAGRTGMTVAEISDITNAMQNRPVSLEGEGSDFEVIQTTESKLSAGLLLETFVRAVAALTDEEQVVIALHYMGDVGHGNQGLQLQQVAERLGVPEQQVSKWHTDGVLKIHARLLKIANSLIE